MKYVRFWGNAGYCGTDYEYYIEYPDDVNEAFIEQDSVDYGYDNADTYSYLETGWGSDWYSDEERDTYYENALDYCGWDYCTVEEYNEHKYD